MKLKGSSIIFSLIVLSFLLVSALSVAVVSVTTRRSSLSTKSSNVSFQVADSTAEVMLNQIYQVNDKGVDIVTAPYGSIADLNALASKMAAIPGVAAACSSSTITGTLSSGTEAYTATLYSADSATPPNFTAIACGDDNTDGDGGWRGKVVKIKFQGSYQGTARAIDVGVSPLP